MLGGMADVTQILAAIEAGDPQRRGGVAPARLRRAAEAAAARLAEEKPGQTLQATALVHEAYLRLVGGEPHGHWNSRGHFFAAAAEAMRRILVESARRKKSREARRRRARASTSPRPSRSIRPTRTPSWTWTTLLTRLAADDPEAAGVAKLRLFAGLSVEEAARALATSRANAYRQWTYARAWLHARLGTGAGSS